MLFEYSKNQGSELLQAISDFITKKIDPALNGVNIKEMNQPASHLTQLEERHFLLDKINSALIYDHLNITNDTLLINWLYITRIPFNLLSKEAWQQIKVIECGHNNLFTLPIFLAECEQLETIHCSQNQLSSLPDTLIEKLGVCWAYNTLRDQNLPSSEISHNLLYTGFNHAKKRVWNMLPTFDLFKNEEEKKGDIVSKKESNKRSTNNL